MTYELIVVWETGEKEIHPYNSREEAKQAAEGYRMAFGNQVWTGVQRWTGVQ